MSSILAVLSIALAGTAAFVLVPAAWAWAAKAASGVSRRARMRDMPLAASGASSFGEHSSKVSLRTWLKTACLVVVEGGFPPLSRPARILLGIPAVESACARMAAGLEKRGIESAPEAFCQFLLLACLLAFGAALLVSGSPAVSLLVVAAFAALLYRRLGKAGGAADEELLALMPDALKALGIYYGSGMTILQSFEQVAKETPEPLGRQLACVWTDMQAGRSVPEALAGMRERLRLPQVAFVAVALEVHQKTGGPVQPLLEHAARSISRSLALEKSLRVKTAQSRLSARIVSIMPIGIFLVLTLINPSYVAPFFESPGGIAMLAAACILEIAGIVAVRRILAVDVR